MKRQCGCLFMLYMRWCVEMGVEELDKMPAGTRAKYFEIMRNVSPEKRLKRSFSLTAVVVEIMAEGIRSRNADISDEELRREVIRRRLPSDLRYKAYGW